MASAESEFVEVTTGPEPRASVVWLHGLGADGHDFEPLVPELALADKVAVRFVFPHAPIRPVTVNGGYAMRAWYDILGVGPGFAEDETGIRDSAERVRGLIEREMARGIPAQRIVLAGFSQGGAIALHLGLRFPHRLAGIMALSTYLPLQASIEAESHTANADASIFMAHGTADTVIPIGRGRDARDCLSGLGYAVEWRDYPMAHEVCWEEVRTISAWLVRVLTS